MTVKGDVSPHVVYTAIQQLEALTEALVDRYEAKLHEYVEIISGLNQALHEERLKNNDNSSR